MGTVARALARLIGFERRIDRIERHHRRHQRGLARPAGDEIAGRDDRAADAPVDRRSHTCELEVQLRLAQRRLDGGDLRGRLLGKRRTPIAFLGGHPVFAREPIRTLQLAGGPLYRGADTLELRAKAIDFSLERTGIDLKEEVSLFHQRSFIEAGRRKEP